MNPTSAASQIDADNDSRSRRRTRRRSVYSLGGLFAVGLFLGIVGVVLTKRESAATAPVGESPNQELDERHSHEELPPTKGIDDLLQIGDYQRAAEIAKRGATNLARDIRPSVFYRLALCQESLGDPQAVQTFAKLVDESTSNRMTRAAQFGIVRCAIRRSDLERATGLLAKLKAHIGDSEIVDLNYSGELKYWEAALQQALSFNRAHRIVDQFSWTPELQAPASRYCQWADVPRHHLAATRNAFEWNEPWRVADAEVTMPERMSSKYERLSIALNEAVLELPQHPLASAAKVQLALLALKSNDSQRALDILEEVRSQASDAAIVRLAEFHLGIIRLRSNDYATARDWLMQVVDRNPQDELAGMAWWYVARSHLDRDECDLAARALNYAASNSSPDVRALAALGQCAMHLRLGNDSLALESLEAGPRRALRTVELRPMCDVLGSLAKLRVARKRRPRALAETEALAEALNRTSHESPIGPIGEWFRGLAMRELGWQSRTIEHFDRVRLIAARVWAAEMEMVLGEEKFELGDVNAARPHFLVVAATGSNSLRYRANLGLAKSAWRSKQQAECLKYCFEACAIQRENHEALRLMGRVYELLNDPKRAALCFGGSVPKN